MIKAESAFVSTEVDFEKLKQIGEEEGANSDVFVIRDHQLDTERAAKEIDTAKFSEVDEYFAEAKKMHKASHPNVVPVHFAGIGHDNGRENVYIVMDYYPEGSLAGLHKRRVLQVGEVVRYGLQFLTGLAFIHSRDIAHFDLKPTNVLIKSDGVAAITDFGIAKWLDADGAAVRPMMYTPHIAPERARTGMQTHQTDIYQAGLTLYRLCNSPEEWDSQLKWASTHYAPIPSDSIALAVVDGAFPDRGTFLPHVPEKLRDVIRKATAIYPDDRYNTVREMMNDLGRVRRYLKWQMHPDGSETGHEAWSMQDERGRIFRIQICQNGGGWSVETTKTVNDTQKVHSCCADGIKSRERALTRVQTFIRSKDIGVS